MSGVFGSACNADGVSYGGRMEVTTVINAIVASDDIATGVVNGRARAGGRVWSCIYYIQGQRPMSL